MRNQSETVELLRHLPPLLAADVKGQSHVIEPLCRVLYRGELELTNPHRPRGSFLFVGPTGVGKTELTLAMGRRLGLGEPFRIDMSEFQNQSSVGELLGFDGQKSRFEVMVERLGNGGIVLFDEMEKAHRLVLDLMLQILDAARVTVAGGKTINFSNRYVVMTSNIGAAEAMRMKSTNNTMFQKAILDRVRQVVRPEFYNRFTLKMAFRALEWEDQVAIAKQLVEGVCFRMKAKGYDVNVDANGLRRIIEKGIDREQGARPLRNVAEDFIEYAIAKAIVDGRKPAGVLTAAPLSDDLEYADVAAA